MCTLVLCWRPDADWPLLLAANRDELASRPWRPPARHWPDRPEVRGGIDLLSGGSWLGVNDYGVVAAVLNRAGTLGPLEGKRSRGELVLEALDHADASEAALALADLDPSAYRPFNLIVVDARDAFWLRHGGQLPPFALRTPSGAWRDPIRLPGPAPARGQDHAAGVARVECQAIPEGLSMIGARDLSDPASRRIEHYLPRFRRAPLPVPAEDDWDAWIELLGDRDAPDGDPTNAMTIVTDGDYGTLCSHLVALPAFGEARLSFCAGRPGEAPFEPVAP